MTSVARPTLVSHPSTQSSPPPSPVATASPSSPIGHRCVEQLASQPLDIGSSPGVNKTPTRPRLPGRQETPPSPPNSLVLGNHSPISPAIQNTPSPTGPTSQTGYGHPEDSTPPASLKQRITRVFKAEHRRGGSDLSRLTSTTVDATKKDSIGYLPSSLKGNIQMHTNFGTRQPTASIRSNNHSNNGGSTKRRVMNGGEVRVEILPHPSLAAGSLSNYGNTRGESSKRGRERGISDPYCKYYTRSSRDADEDFDEDEGEIRKSYPGCEENLYLPPLNRQGVAKLPPQRSQTVVTQESPESQGRKYVEESVSLGFEGFHIGNRSSYSDGTFAGLSNPSSPAFSTGAGIYSNSGKASSSVLNYLNQSDLNILSREPSVRTTPVSGRSSSGVGRPGMSRNASSSASRLSPGMRMVSPGPGRSGSPQLDEAVTRELRRLSKISGGSGASGFAMVITSDGAASTKVDDFGDEEMDSIASERRFTKEEKGKGKAVSSASSESMAERGAGDSRSGYKTNHQHTISDASKAIRSDGSEDSSDNGDSDGARLLKGVDDGNGRKRKLKSQEVPKGVLVHKGDTKYDFVYRMRQTSDATPILVPQYFYSADGFPNRNALTTPVRAKLSPLAPTNTGNNGTIPFTGQYGSSPITMPQNAVKRPPDSSSSFYIGMVGGDQAVDPQDGSPRSPDYRSDRFDSHHGSMTHSLSENKMQSLVHPAFRSSGQQQEEGRRQRPVVSMGSLEGIAGFDLGRLVTGTSNGTGRRLAGSSLADDSDMSNRLEDSPNKRRKRVRMSGVGEIDPIPPLQRNTAAPYLSAESKVWIPPYHSTRLPMRPKNLRRSMTPRLYDPRPLGDSWKDLSDYDAEAMRNELHSRAYRMKEKRVSRIILALCLLFPPLLLLAAMGSFDTIVDGWTDGEVKKIGKIEKTIAAVIGGVFAISVIISGVVAAVLVAR